MTIPEANPENAPSPDGDLRPPGIAGLGIVERAVAVLQDELAGSPVPGTPAPALSLRPAVAVTPQLDPSLLPTTLGADLGPIMKGVLGLLGAVENALCRGYVPRMDADGRGSGATPALAAEQTPVRADGEGSAGQIAELTIGLANDHSAAPAAVELCCSDLLDGMGRRIPAEHVRVDPSALYLQPGESADVSINVDVPVGTSPGSYRGVLQAVNTDGLQAIVSVRVV
jgi:hypothetical protein